LANVLVTGANGFLGSWLCKKLIANGHSVSALVRKTSDLSELKGLQISYLIGDVTNYDSVFSAAKDCDAIFHLAGLIAYKKSDRPAMERINVQGTANVIKAAASAKTKRLVYLSSVVAVGASASGREILDETSTYNLRDEDFGYFETKRKAEELVISACKAQSIDAVILNPSTIYGPGDAKKGSRKTQLKVAQGKFPFIPTGGVNVVSVEDVVDGIIAAWERGKSGERYILCGDNITIEKLFEIIANAAGVKPPRIHLPKFALYFLGFLGDVLNRFGVRSSLSLENAKVACYYHWFSCEKARRELGFNPHPSEYAINQSVKWVKDSGLA
jgi:dihydroflavonol-4-reductase